MNNYSEALENHQKQAELGKVSTLERREHFWLSYLHGFSPEGKYTRHGMASTN